MKALCLAILATSAAGGCWNTGDIRTAAIGGSRSGDTSDDGAATRLWDWLDLLEIQRNGLTALDVILQTRQSYIMINTLAG